MMSKDIHDALKELYRVPLEAPEELNKRTLEQMKGSRQNRYGYRKAVALAGVAAALATVILVSNTSLAENIKKVFRGFWKQQQDVNSYVKTGIYEDSDEHLLLSVEEVLSDQVCVQAVVKLEAKDEDGKRWLKDYNPAEYLKKDWDGSPDTKNYQLLYLSPDFTKPRAVSGSYATELIKDQSTDSVQYYSLQYNAAEWSEEMGRCILHYSLPSGTFQSVNIDTKCNVPVYEYELKAEKNKELSKYYEPKRIRLTKFSCVIYGKNQAYFRETDTGNSHSWWMLLSPEQAEKELARSIVLLKKDGSRIRLSDFKDSGLGGVMNSDARKENPGCDMIVAAYQILDIDESDYPNIKAKTNGFDPEEMIEMEMKNVHGTVTYSFCPLG